uniref:Uncharacterized protein n=1 Tax=Spironucleus salmonicida TaxID=348837 RepID=V6LGQ4_9EUKA|eukprot:EST43720.1 Hypothetical protein SS50377_16774 [Spironucleus salmonicida]
MQKGYYIFQSQAFPKDRNVNTITIFINFRVFKQQWLRNKLMIHQQLVIRDHLYSFDIVNWSNRYPEVLRRVRLLLPLITLKLSGFVFEISLEKLRGVMKDQLQIGVSDNSEIFDTSSICIILESIRYIVYLMKCGEDSYIDTKFPMQVWSFDIQ